MADTDPANNSFSLCISKSVISSKGVLSSSDLKARKAQKNTTMTFDIFCQIRVEHDTQDDVGLTFIAAELETGPKSGRFVVSIKEL